MSLRNLVRIIGLLACLVVLPIQAANLMQVYQEALLNDPTFKQNQAAWLAARENLPIARSGYLTQFDIQFNADEAHTDNQPTAAANISNINGFHERYGILATLTQPVFNAAQWHAIESARAAVKSATATYFAQVQDLMFRTVQAYLAVLQAYDKLRFTIANKRAVYRQLETAREKFKVGLIAVTGVYDAKSRYDITVAEEIEDRNAMNDQIENLRAITGIHYKILAGLSKDIPLSTPKPNNINQWVHVAVLQNYGLRAQEYAVDAAREKIHQDAAGAYPRLSIQGELDQRLTFDHANSPDISLRTATAGLLLDFPFIQGGFVIATTKQARYQYLDEVGKLEFTHRDVVNQTRQSFLGTIALISRIKADKQAIESSQNALEATEAGYTVGTRTMVDVLNDLAQVYDAQRIHADDQYRYLLSIIELKQAAGTLSTNDLEKLNQWLNKNIKLPIPKAAYGPVKHSRKKRPVKKEREFYRYKSYQYDANSSKDKSKGTSKDNLKNKMQNIIQNPTMPDMDKDKTTTPESTTPDASKDKTPAPKSTTPDTSKDKTLAPKSTTPDTNKNKTTTPNTSTPDINKSNTIKKNNKKNTIDIKNQNGNRARNKAKEKLSQNTNDIKNYRYTIQLYTDTNKVAAWKYIYRLKLHKPIQLVKRLNEYQVLYGNYPSYRSARKDLARLPKNLTKYKPEIILRPKSKAQRIKLHHRSHHNRVLKHKVSAKRIIKNKSRKPNDFALPAPKHTKYKHHQVLSINTRPNNFQHPVELPMPN